MDVHRAARRVAAGPLGDLKMISQTQCSEPPRLPTRPAKVFATMSLKDDLIRAPATLQEQLERNDFAAAMKLYVELVQRVGHEDETDDKDLQAERRNLLAQLRPALQEFLSPPAADLTQDLLRAHWALQQLLTIDDIDAAHLLYGVLANRVHLQRVFDVTDADSQARRTDLFAQLRSALLEFCGPTRELKVALCRAHAALKQLLATADLDAALLLYSTLAQRTRAENTAVGIRKNVKAERSNLLAALRPRLVAFFWQSEAPETALRDLLTCVLPDELLAWGDRDQRGSWGVLSLPQAKPVRSWIDATTAVFECLDCTVPPEDWAAACRKWVAHRFMKLLKDRSQDLETFLNLASVKLHNRQSVTLAHTIRQPVRPRRLSEDAGQQPLALSDMSRETENWVHLWQDVVLWLVDSLGRAERQAINNSGYRPFLWWDPAEHTLFLELVGYGGANFRGHQFASSAIARKIIELGWAQTYTIPVYLVSHEYRFCVSPDPVHSTALYTHLCDDVCLVHTGSNVRYTVQEHAHSWPVGEGDNGLRCPLPACRNREHWKIGSDTWLLNPQSPAVHHDAVIYCSAPVCRCSPACASAQVCRTPEICQRGVPCVEHGTHFMRMLKETNIAPGVGPAIADGADADDIAPYDPGAYSETDVKVALQERVDVAKRFYRSKQSELAGIIHSSARKRNSSFHALEVLLGAALGKADGRKGWPDELDDDQAHSLTRAIAPARLVSETDLLQFALSWTRVIKTTCGVEPNELLSEKNLQPKRRTLFEEFQEMMTRGSSS